MQGQACGCLGNTFYLIGNYSKALYYYKKRLGLAQKSADVMAERRAYRLVNSTTTLYPFD